MNNERLKSNPLTHYVYIFCAHRKDRFVSPVKIGISDNPERRLREINSTACPYEIACCETFALPAKALAHRIERNFHTVYEENRLAREWFDMDPVEARTNLIAGLVVTMATDGMSFGRAKQWSEIAKWSFNLTEEIYSKITNIAGGNK